MNTLTPVAEDTGLEVIDLHDNPEFAHRRIHARNLADQMEGLDRLMHAFVERPDTILQELVNAAIDLCGAQSAGISIEKEQRTDADYWHWVATAGKYSGFLNASLPRSPSACGLTLQRGHPQLFRVNQRFFDIMQVQAPVVTDGILLPWQVDETRGTIWIMSHDSAEAFDSDDVRVMQLLAGFAALAVRQQRQQVELMRQATAAAAAAMANQLAHQINNPLQSLTNLIYLAESGQTDSDARSLAADLSPSLRRLSELVYKLLGVPA